MKDKLLNIFIFIGAIVMPTTIVLELLSIFFRSNKSFMLVRDIFGYLCMPYVLVFVFFFIKALYKKLKKIIF